MGAILRYLEKPDAPSDAIKWFKNLEHAPEFIGKPEGKLLYFSQFGSLETDEDENVDVSRSPLVSFVQPQLRRGILYTVGEVHFLPSWKTFPELDKIARKFRKWLGQHEIVFDPKRVPASDFEYFLEGSIPNFDAQIIALPSGLSELRRGRYFISHSDNEHTLDCICKKLSLRGVNCE